MPRGDASPDLIREAALAAFAAHGIKAASLKMIADALGVTKAALYHHHRTKDSIARAVLAPAIESVAVIVEAASRVADPLAARRQAVTALAEHAVANRALYAVMLREWPSVAISASDQETMQVFDGLRGVLRAGDDSPATAAAVAMFLSGLTAPATDPDLAELEDEVLRTVIIEIGQRLLADLPRPHPA